MNKLELTKNCYKSQTSTFWKLFNQEVNEPKVGSKMYKYFIIFIDISFTFDVINGPFWEKNPKPSKWWALQLVSSPSPT